MQDFLGKGWSFPLRPTAARRLGWSAGEEKVRQSIYLILATAPGERRMRPEFGCGIHDLVFEANTASLHSRLPHLVREALRRFEPRIDVTDVRIEAPEEARNFLLIRVDYRIRATNNYFNLVYPYYLTEGPG